MKGVLVLLALLAGYFLLRRLWRKPDYPYHAKGTLLTAAELAFFKVLDQAIPADQMIAPKVRLGDVVGCSDSDWSRGYGPRISAKHLDFVITERSSSRIIAAIELDDSSHTRPERIDRDEFVNGALEAAGIPLIRIPCASSYSLPDLRQALERALQP